MSGSVILTSGAFTEIPIDWRVPGAYMEVTAAVNQNAVLDFPARGLLFGQMYSAGTATSGVPVRITSPSLANSLFGAGSQAAMMCAAWINANPYTPLYAVGLADAPTAVHATGSITIGGAATAPGALCLRVGGVPIQVGVNIGDTAAEVAANLYAQLNLQGQSGYQWLPFLTPSYVAAADVVTLTCAHGGTLGNLIDVRVDNGSGNVIPAGLTVQIAAMSGGAADPIAAITTAVSELSAWYTDIAWPWVDATSLGVLIPYLTQSYGAMEQRDCQAYVCFDGTYGTALNFAPNCPYLCDLPMQNPLTHPSIAAAVFAAVCCFQSAQQPALQMAKVGLPGVVAPADADVFTPAARQQLLEAGHSTFRVDQSGAVNLERVVTTCRIDQNGVPTTAYFDLNCTKVPTRVRYDWDGYIGQLWPRNQLCEDGTLAAQYNPNAVTPNQLLASWTSRCAVYEQNGWIQNSAQTSKMASFNIDPSDGNRANARQPIQIMGNLMVLAGSLQFISNN